uniref:Uncharacterized protein n=1 Tax=Arundo donax TaxID=35708 RepID=A0A0A8YI05_ARUDO
MNGRVTGNRAPPMVVRLTSGMSTSVWLGLIE